jgi:hypothetical protein
MSPDRSFHCEVEKSKEKDERGNQVTAVKCHGRLVSETASAVGVSRLLCKRPGFVFGDGVRGRGQFPFPGSAI